jgi:hypothetical protein
MVFLICWLRKQSPAYQYAKWSKLILLLDKSPPRLLIRQKLILYIT